MAVGRPTKYTPELLEKAREYLSVYADKGEAIPSIVGFAIHCGIHKSMVYEWMKDPEKKEFSDIAKDIVQHQEMVLMRGGLLKTFDSSITKLILGKHGYSDKQEVDHKSGDGSMSPNRVEIVAPESK